MDTKTLIICNIFVPLFLGFAMLAFRSQQKTYAGFIQWTAGNFLIAAGYVMLLVRLFIPEVISIVVGNGLFILAALVFLDGLLRFLRGRAMAGAWYAAMPAALAACLYFYFVYDNIAMRAAVTMGFICTFTLGGAWLLWRSAPPGSRRLYRGTALCFFLYLPIAVARGVQMSMNATGNIFSVHFFMGLYFTALMLLEVAWTICFLMMTYQRLEDEWRLARSELTDTVTRLEKALAEIRTLGGLLPICSGCKKIRDDQGYWRQIEQYISEHSDATFTHGLCPECRERLYPELSEDK